MSAEREVVQKLQEGRRLRREAEETRKLEESAAKKTTRQQPSEESFNGPSKPSAAKKTTKKDPEEEPSRAGAKKGGGRKTSRTQENLKESDETCEGCGKPLVECEELEECASKVEEGTVEGEENEALNESTPVDTAAALIYNALKKDGLDVSKPTKKSDMIRVIEIETENDAFYITIE